VIRGVGLNQGRGLNQFLQFRGNRLSTVNVSKASKQRQTTHTLIPQDIRDLSIEVNERWTINFHFEISKYSYQ
jgi:hypothetical protein